MALTKISGSVIKDSVSLSVNVSVGGTLTYQDVTNVDALGIGTFRTGINVSGGQLDVGSNIKLGNAGVITATTFSGAVSGTTGSFSGQVNVGSNIKLGTAGVITATTFVGALTGNISGGTVAGSTGTFTGDVDIADKIVHTGDTNTAIRFPEADHISLETGGSERLRLNNQYLIKGHTSVYPIAGHYPSVQLTGTTFNDATLSLINNANDATGSYIYLSKQRSGSQGGATVVQDDDLVGQIGWTAGDGTDVTSRIAEIKGMVDGTPGSNDTPGRLSFWTTADGAQSSTERLRIDSSGRIGIGENNPTRDIVIKKSGSVQVSMVGATNQSVYLNFGDTDDDNIGAVYYDNPNDRMIIRANTNNAVQVKSSGNMAINDGDLEIGTSGHGISFAATGDATGMSNELLDDYEEGSFTATLSASGGGATFASGHIQTACLYVKIGGMVHVQGYFSGTNVTNGGTGIVKVSGLPFASNNTTYYTICLTHNTMTGQQCTGAYIQYANTYFFPIQTGSTSGSAFNVGNPRYLMFGGSYPVQF